MAENDVSQTTEAIEHAARADREGQYAVEFEAPTQHI